jgi:myo-inositol 2-dehydrogenase/D-chiro-inositol 1-dehydrogenase
MSVQQSLQEQLREVSMTKIAVLGCGRIGRMHAANIAAHPRAELAAVYDIHRPSAEAVAKEHGVAAADSAEAVFASSDVDAVLVATVTDTHADYIEKAVAAGKPVLCEKPIDLSLERVNRCADAVSSKGVPIQIGFNRRFDPGHRAARKAAHSGEIGDLHQVIITSRDPGMPPRSYYEVAGGLFRDMVIHDFDLARYMLGEEPMEVFAIGGRLIDPALMDELDDYDTAMVIMRTASGKQCHINNSRTATYGYDQRVELLGSAGMVISGNRKPHELRRFGGTETDAAEPYLNFFIERYREAFDAEIDAFVDCIEKGKAPEVGFEDGRRALILAEAAMKSAIEGRFVKVDEIGR